MGKFLKIIYCTLQTDQISIANCLQGVAQVIFRNLKINYLTLYQK